MLLLTSTSDKIQVVTGAAADVRVHASWMKNASGTITASRTNTAAITTATTTDVVAAPGSGEQVNVKHLNISNVHASTTCTVSIQHTDGTNVEILYEIDLLAGEACVLDSTGKWNHFDTDGGPYPQLGPIATRAAVIAGTLLIGGVTPGDMGYHTGMVKAHVRCGVAGDIKSDYNVSSVTDTAAGRCAILYTTNMADANYAICATVERSSTTLTVTNAKSVNVRLSTQTASTFELECYDDTATTAATEDPLTWSVAVCGVYA